AELAGRPPTPGRRPPGRPAGRCAAADADARLGLRLRRGGAAGVIWIPITVGAATLQVARNALQRGLLAGAGPWGATLVRFLFGLPFSLAFAAVALAVWPSARPAFTSWFWLACVVGGACQIAATAAMLVSMRRSTFALGTAFQQSSIPIAAFIGLIFREQLHPLAWAGLFLVTGGLFVLAWPRKLAEGPRDWTPALLGLVAGAGF